MEGGGRERRGGWEEERVRGGEGEEGGRGGGERRGGRGGRGEEESECGAYIYIRMYTYWPARVWEAGGGKGRYWTVPHTFSLNASVRECVQSTQPMPPRCFHPTLHQL